MKLLLGDCLEKLKELDDNSVDSIVTDPPYGLAFMGKQWDYDVPSVDIWKECLRVLKPGGHLLAFAGSRTYHRMAVRIEDAGFEIRDQIMWVYGSGFPKSMDISKQIDKKFGAEREVIGTYDPRSKFDGSNREDREIGGQQVAPSKTSKLQITAPATDEAKKWQGWGTALKPAHEPVVMARKPLSENTVVDNVLEWGTGGINIDDSRIPYQNDNDRSGWHKTGADGSKGYRGEETFKIRPISADEIQERTAGGRFPANIVFDEEAGKILDEQTGILSSGFMKAGTPRLMSDNPNKNTYGKWNTDTVANDTYGDSGGASRFFYCPKTSKTDRNEGLGHLEDKYYAAGNQAKAELKRGNVDFNANEGKGRDERHNHNQVGVSKNNHPTVKPTDLMLYLIRLVTPKGGTTLDPFMGSGSTGKAAVRGGFDFIGIEREQEYFEIAEARIQYEINNPYKEETGERIEINKNSENFW
jgi:DNA modification methylase